MYSSVMVCIMYYSSLLHSETRYQQHTMLLLYTVAGNWCELYDTMFNVEKNTTVLYALRNVSSESIFSWEIFTSLRLSFGYTLNTARKKDIIQHFKLEDRGQYNTCKDLIFNAWLNMKNIYYTQIFASLTISLTPIVSKFPEIPPEESLQKYHFLWINTE